MRILDDEYDRRLDSIILFLTREELGQLGGYVQQLLEDQNCDHVHLSSQAYHKEITLCIYDPNDTEKFDKRIQKLIQADE